MKKLNERRDELAKEYAYPDGPPKGQTCQFALERGYIDGFSAAVEELMPQVNKLVEALDFYMKIHDSACYLFDLHAPEDCNCRMPIKAAMTKKEWQQFIGDEK